MEPKLPAPHPSPEMGGYHQQEAPVNKERQAVSPIEQKAERGEAHETADTPRSDGPSLPAPQALAAPAADQAMATSQTATPVTDDAPLVAADDELIEKEWVDKAKKIVSHTKDDPYRQEKEVSKLQADYLKKRYGKEIKLRDDS